jgi:hypothetical protein
MYLLQDFLQIFQLTKVFVNQIADNEKINI